MQEPKKLEVPSFTRWIEETIEQNKKLPRVRNGYEKNRNTPTGFKALSTKAAPDATSD